MRVAAVQLDIVWQDKTANHLTIERMLDDADVVPGTFVVLPELGDTGFSFDLDAIADARSLAWAVDLARRRSIWVQVGYARRGDDGRGRNCATIVAPSGDVVGTYEKVHPFSFGRESEHFSAGDRLLTARCGDARDHARVCPLICYDLRFPELWRLAAVVPVPAQDDDDSGQPTSGPAEVFTIGASWPAARQSHWRALLVARAIENQAYVIGVNRIGADPHIAYAGGSMIVAPSGEIVADAGERAAVLQTTLDLEELRAWRARFPALRDARRELLGSIRAAPVQPAPPPA